MKEDTLLMLDGKRHMIKSKIFILTLPIVFSAFLLTSVVCGASDTKRPSSGTRVWDTQSPFVGEINLADRAGWKAIDSPRSDNAQYKFKGDAVVENQHITLVLSSEKGKVSLYSKADSNEKKVELVPLELKGKPARITGCTLIRNTSDETVLEVSFSGGGAEDKLSAVLSLGSKGILAIKPAKTMKGISLLSSIEYGVVPAFIGDDLIFDARKYPSMSTLHVPCENLFLGLLKGRNDMLIVTWPDGEQKVRLVLDGGAENRLIESVDFDNDGKSMYVALLHAPGIWHKEELKPSYLEKDVAIDWACPFLAKWKTQLLEAGVKTTFKFRDSNKEIWRAAIGYYTYPVWFEGQKAYFHLGKKIPPAGESLIYYLEGTSASGWPTSAADILKQTLDQQTSERKLALRARANMDLVRPVSQADPNGLDRHNARSSRPAATCPITQSLESIFKAGQEQDKRDEVESGVEDMVYFLTQHRKRIERYMNFARDMTVFLEQEEKSKPDLNPFLSEMEAVAREIPQEYQRVKDNIKDLDYAAGLAQQTKALTRERRPKNLEAFLDLGQKWRSMGGAQDDLIREFHTMTRKLFQKAGYGCAGQPEAVEIAQEIRRRCEECLTNPSSYEIWWDY